MDGDTPTTSRDRSGDRDDDVFDARRREEKRMGDRGRGQDGTDRRGHLRVWTRTDRRGDVALGGHLGVTAPDPCVLGRCLRALLAKGGFGGALSGRDPVRLPQIFWGRTLFSRTIL